MRSQNYLTPFDLKAVSCSVMEQLADWDSFNCEWVLKEELPKVAKVIFPKNEDFLEVSDQIEVLLSQNKLDYKETMIYRSVFKVIGIRREKHVGLQDQSEGS